MNIVINPSKCTQTSITASNKIALWISSLLKIKLVDDKQTATIVLGYGLDTVFIVNGMFGFCDFRDEITKICQKAKEVIWIGNDYAIKFPSNLSFLKNDIKLRRIAQYSNFDGMKNHQYIDFNKLLHWNGVAKPYQYEGLFYYGAFRKDRVKSFKRWLGKSAVPIHVSTSARNFDEFSEINPKMKIYKSNGDIRKILPKFQASIYIEDEFSHSNEMSPANRFYEVVGAKSLLFYDNKCKKTLSKAGYWDETFSVSHIEDVEIKLKNYDKLREKQIKMFEGKDFRKELEKEFLQTI